MPLLRSFVLPVVALALGGLGAPPCEAAACSVPGSHATLASAVLDASCSEITLAAQVYAESVVVDRDLTLSGAGSAATTLSGRLTIEGAGTAVRLVGLRVDAAAAPGLIDAITVGAGAETRLSDVLTSVSAASFEIFADGFESGDTSAWEIVVP